MESTQEHEWSGSAVVSSVSEVGWQTRRRERERTKALRRARQFGLVALMLLALPRVASSEVRAVEAGRDAATEFVLDVHLTSQGVWSPRGEAGPRDLNPHGDLHGDGFPGHAAKGSQILAAWRQPAEASFALALWDGACWRDFGDYGDGSAQGTPMVVPLDDGWLVAHRRSEPELGFLLQGVGSSGPVGEPLALSRYHLIGLFQIGGGVHVLAVSGSGELFLGTISFVPRVPEPIDFVWQQVGVLARGSSDRDEDLLWAFPIDNPDEPILEFRLVASPVALDAWDHGMNSTVVSGVSQVTVGREGATWHEAGRGNGHGSHDDSRPVASVGAACDTGQLGLVWQRDGETPSVVLSSGWSPAEPSGRERVLVPGRLLWGSSSDGNLTLLVFTADGRLEAHRFVFAAPIHRPPIDIFAQYVPQIPIPIPTASRDGAGSFPAAPGAVTDGVARVILPDDPIVIEWVPRPGSGDALVGAALPNEPIDIFGHHVVSLDHLLVSSALPNEPIEPIDSSRHGEASLDHSLSDDSTTMTAHLLGDSSDVLLAWRSDRQHLGLLLLPRADAGELVSWQEPGDQIATAASMMAPGTRLLTAAVLGSQLHWVGLTDDGTLVAYTASLPDTPDDMPLSSASVPSVPAPLDFTSLTLDRLEAHGALGEARTPSARLRVVDVKHSDERVMLLTWWTEPAGLSFIELDEGGPVLPVETLVHPGGSERPASLVREAERVVRARHE